jgi:hypothetical protein
MARRKISRKTSVDADKLVPALRDAIKIADRALSELKLKPPKRKRAKPRGGPN